MNQDRLPRLRVAMTGASGLIGSALTRRLTSEGHTVVPVVRGTPRPGAISWDPERGVIDASALEGVDAVVHLAGESVARRWTDKQRERILSSRIQGTNLLSRTLAALAQPPRVLVSASAIGIYGDRGDEQLSEDARLPGEGSPSFLAQVAAAWEAATQSAERAGIRVVHLRTGIVLTTAGGALKPMLLPFRMGLGGRLGHGRQWMSWITLDDLLGAYAFALESEDLRGAVNGVAPNPVTNREFTRSLAEVLHTPALFPAPAAILRLALGRMADELLLSSQRVIPEQLETHGFHFRFPDLKPALVHVLSQ